MKCGEIRLRRGSPLVLELALEGALPLADQTSRIVAELERNEFGELHLFTLVIFMKVDSISSHC